MTAHIFARPLIDLSPQGPREYSHRCGLCANPFTNGRADCPNAPRIDPMPTEYDWLDNPHELWSEDD